LATVDQLDQFDGLDWLALPTALIEREALTAQLDREDVEGSALASLFTVPSASRDGRPPAATDAGGRIAELRTAFEDRVAKADQIFVNSVEDGGSPLTTIVYQCELSTLEARILALCAAPELDIRLQSLIGQALAGHSLGGSPRRMTVQLLRRIYGPDAVRALGDDGRLSRAGLIEVEPLVPFAAAEVTVPRRVIWALCDERSLDPDLPLGAHVQLVPDSRAIGQHTLLLVHGADSVRRTQAAMLAGAGLAFLLVDQPTEDRAWRAIVRQASTAGLGVVLSVTGGLTALGRHWVERADHLTWAIAAPAPLELESLPRTGWIELSAAAEEATDAEWLSVFPGDDVPPRRPTAHQLYLAGLAAQPGDDPDVALRRLASGSIASLAKRVVPRATWADLVVPDAHVRRLESLVDRYRNREVVHGDWGLPAYPSPGLVVLFSGPSGTGKTTTAEVLANELGVDMFRVDLSALVSKYIGETEKNLEQIFSAAHAGNYLLLFDEADSLFGSRSKVTDSKDRYANMEVSYLLQRLETYDGFVVLTSNFQGNIDLAFMRRIHAAVHFPVPGADDRRRIWERALGQAPTVDLDLAFVADKFDLTGGAIRNAALTAAFLAAAEHRPIGMPHMLRALFQEMLKLGRRTGPEMFGPWKSDVADLIS
jgi:AAA+ superfamily predicted ATPase